MRRKITILLLIAVMLGLGSLAAKADTYSDAWQPTTPETYYIQFNITTATDLYIYDWGDKSDVMLVLSGTGSTGVTFASLGGGNYRAFIDSIGDNQIYDTGESNIILDGNNWFGIRFGTSTYSYNFEKIYGAQGLYLLTSNGSSVYQANAAPIPIPPTALLLGSGLVGLLFLARRRKS